MSDVEQARREWATAMHPGDPQRQERRKAAWADRHAQELLRSHEEQAAEIERLWRERETLAAAVLAEQRLRRAHERHGAGYQKLNDFGHVARLKREADEAHEAAVALIKSEKGGGGE